MKTILKDKDVKIIDYKPTPRPNEENIGGSESGGRVRLAKFYLEHVTIKSDGDEIIRHEEVQIYPPSTDGRSGFYWHKKKKEDDDRYSKERISETGGAHSFAELMFALKLYPELRKIFVGLYEKYRRKKTTD